VKKPPRLKLVAWPIRPPEIHQSDGERISIEVTVNGAKRCDLRAWDPTTDKTLLTDSINIVRSRERQAFVDALPEECRTEAANLLLVLSEQVIERRQTPNEFSDDHPENTADLQTGGLSGSPAEGLESAGESASGRQSAVPPDLAKEQNILAKVKQAGRQLGLAGVSNLMALIYLVLTSRLLTAIRPASLVIKGPSAGGKSFPVEQIVKLVPAVEVPTFTAVTDKSLIYDDRPLSHKTLVLLEAQSLSSDFFSYMIRSLLSEGHVRYLTTEKGEDGEFHSREIVRPGPTGLIVTTIASAIESQTETRILSITVDDTKDQTKRILKKIASGPISGGALVVVVFAPWHELQDWLAAGERRVVIPFAPALAEAIPALAVRLRRDFTTLLSLISAHALLHRATRTLDPEGRIVATLDDYAAVRGLVGDAMGEGVAVSVSPSLRRTVEAVEAYTKAKGASLGMNYSELGRALEIDSSAAQRRAETAIEQGYLVNDQKFERRPAQLIVTKQKLPEDDKSLLPAVAAVREAMAKLQTADPVQTGVQTDKAAPDKGIGGQSASLHENPSDEEERNYERGDAFEDEP
jgi:hypothetical protein